MQLKILSIEFVLCYVMQFAMPTILRDFSLLRYCMGDRIGLPVIVRMTFLGHIRRVIFLNNTFSQYINLGIEIFPYDQT